ncbi:MAG: GNAT family N-acetyltransferase [Pseudomonadota bacterium]|nr:GNAT family N-acetyltransferase [Pseudomonadota bacterium]
MTSVTYRDVEPGDAAMIADLFAQSFVETFGDLYKKEDLDSFLAGVTPEAFAAEIADTEFALRVCEVGGQAIGFAKLGPPSLPIDTPPDTIELWQIYVLGPWQGQGVAQRLYDWAEEEARRRGAKHLQLTVYIDNHRARSFYDRRDFTVIGRYDFMVGNHADEDLIMRKAL